MVSLIEATPLSLLEVHSSHAFSLWKSQSNTFDPAKGKRGTIARTKLAALYSATKALQNGCTAGLQLKCSCLTAFLQLM